MFLHADSEDSDQTWRKPRLIRVIAGHKGDFVGFVMRRLISVYGEITETVPSSSVSLSLYHCLRGYDLSHVMRLWYVFPLRNLIIQPRMRSYRVGLDV